MSVLLQVCSREFEDKNVFSCYRHMDVWSYSMGDVYTWSGAVAWSQWKSGTHRRTQKDVYWLGLHPGTCFIFLLSSFVFSLSDMTDSTQNRQRRRTAP